MERLDVHTLAQEIAAVIGAVVAEAVRQALAEMTEAQAAAMREIRDAVRLLDRHNGATVADDCDWLVLEVKREIERQPSIAHDCGAWVREVSLQIGRERIHTERLRLMR